MHAAGDMTHRARHAGCREGRGQHEKDRAPNIRRSREATAQVGERRGQIRWIPFGKGPAIMTEASPQEQSSFGKAGMRG
jgi:hypothetical protein